MRRILASVLLVFAACNKQDSGDLVVAERDADGDGFESGTDCDDSDPDVYPGAPEVPDDEVDQNCDGIDRDAAPLSTLGAAVAGSYPSSTFGHDAHAGDLDGDGRADAVVSAPYFVDDDEPPLEVWLVTAPTGAPARYAEVIGDQGTIVSLDVVNEDGVDQAILSYLAGVVGFRAPWLGDVRFEEADVTYTPGFVILAHGDFDGDGVQDMAFGDFTEDEWRGNAHVHFGPLSQTGNTLEGDVILQGAQSYDLFAEAMVTGDVDGDGHQDLLVAAHGEPSGRGVGSVYVFSGPTLAGTLSVDDAWARYTGVNEQGYVGGSDGSSLRAEDVTGDGATDLLIPAQGGGPEAPGAYGGVVWLIDAPAPGSHELVASVPHLVSDATGSWLGAAAAVGPDLNGNGLPELLISAASGYSHYPGAIYGFDLPIDPERFDTASADYAIVGDQPGDAAGNSLAPGDFDGDGRVDLLVGAPGVDTPLGADVGTVTLVLAGALP